MPLLPIAFNKSFRGRAGERGIALFEILVSAAILSAGCLVLMRALTGCLRTVHELEVRSAAAFALEEALWLMDLDHGEFHQDAVQAPDEFQNVFWDVHETPLVQANLRPFLRQRVVTLRWNSSDLTLSAYYARPAS